MVQEYRTEVITPTGATSGEKLAVLIQTTIEKYSSAGWSLVTGFCVSGITMVVKAPLGPYVVLVFRSGV